ncbi:MAG: epoxyqueuosine reductase QueH [Actinomycetota bacterium]
MKILMHACCGPCLIYPAETLREQGHKLTAFFYNPNIHPYSEFARRNQAFREYCGRAGLTAVEEDYDYKNYLRQTIFAEENRCAVCYRMRLGKTAETAAQGGYDAFSTSLLVSPYQRHEELKEAGEAAAAETGVAFFYEDWRDGFREGRRRARTMGLYSQKYCGCIYSEEERFAGG